MSTLRVCGTRVVGKVTIEKAGDYVVSVKPRAGKTGRAISLTAVRMGRQK